MLISESTWQLETASILQKEQLLNHAAACGVRVAHPCLGHHSDADPFISWLSEGVGLGSLPARISDHRPTTLIDEATFLHLCSTHAVAHLPVEAPRLLTR